MKIVICCLVVLCCGIGPAYGRGNLPLDRGSLAAEPAGSPLLFMDSKLFDSRLSAELAGGKEQVEVEVGGRMSLNSIPARLDKWITVVGENGTLEVKAAEPAIKNRSIFLSIASTVYSFLGAVWSERVFEPAIQYNGVVYYRREPSGENVIDRIVFSRKAER